MSLHDSYSSLRVSCLRYSSVNFNEILLQNMLHNSLRYSVCVMGKFVSFPLTGLRPGGWPATIRLAKTVDYIITMWTDQFHQSTKAVHIVILSDV